ncbi:4-alpha-glucanotransferase [Luteolibacter flavescens]|uniref:4-alpha-glucanotransferase n=1 Tax=Luteolibacter flavescens TaxID=1859460 RepID=A0ABT3FN76_9BACT|nr:4-alpha-glucanotransferase [Luteolibacter flavescens]MCW1885027.1 4-alpha-glucanotransferase [Luteolibacter flavescens]
MNQTVLDQPRAGLLVPAYALRRSHDLGIGDTAAVVEAIDFAADHGFSVLQLLPIHETFGDHSPYNPISSRALSPALLTLSPNEVPGLTHAMLEQAAPESWLVQLRGGKNVRQQAVHALKTQILLDAYLQFSEIASPESRADFDDFSAAQASWLDAYTLFRLLVREYEGNTEWADWRPEHRSKEGAEGWLLQHPARESLEMLRAGFAFIQWIGWRQWRGVRAHAEQRGVKVMGEMSFGVGVNSADVWANPSLFDTQWSLGTRPLSHFDTTQDARHWGQNWGLPAYRWENHRSSGFAWLRGRIAWESEFFHACRLDHLRGYFRAYMFPWPGGARHVEYSVLTEEQVAEKTGGLLPRFVPGPDEVPAAAGMNELQGRELIGQIIEAAGEMDLVAEIMGEMPDYMQRTLEDLQLANLSFPQLLRTPDGAVIPPSKFREMSLVTYANHDNAPLASLYLQARTEPDSRTAADVAALLDFAGWTGDWPETLDDELLGDLQRSLMETSGRLAVLMVSDLLGVPLRFNLPGSYGHGTWSDRLEMPLAELARHPVYGPRIARVSGWVHDSGRNGVGGDSSDDAHGNEGDKDGSVKPSRDAKVPWLAKKKALEKVPVGPPL